MLDVVDVVKGELEDGGVGGEAMVQGLEIGGGEEDEGEGIVVRAEAGAEHAEVELEGEREAGVESDKGADDDVEGKVVGAWVLGKKEEGVGEVAEEEEPGEEVVGLADGTGEHVGVDLFEASEGGALLEQREDPVVPVVRRRGIGRQRESGL